MKCRSSGKASSIGSRDCSFDWPKDVAKQEMQTFGLFQNINSSNLDYLNLLFKQKNGTKKLTGIDKY